VTMSNSFSNIVLYVQSKVKYLNQQDFLSGLTAGSAQVRALGVPVRLFIGY
jgi:hypothetical protein